MIKKITSLIALLIGLCFVSSTFAQKKAISKVECYPDGCAALLEEAEKYGPQLLIVRLNVPELEKFKTKKEMPRKNFDAIVEQRKIAIDEVRNRVLNKLKPYNVGVSHLYNSIPEFSLYADVKIIRILIADPQVKRLFPNWSVGLASNETDIPTNLAIRCLKYWTLGYIFTKQTARNLFDTQLYRFLAYVISHTQ